MFRTKNKALLLGLALLLTMNTFGASKGRAVMEQTQDSNLEEGQLLKVKGIKGGAVYQVGPDGKKYIFPDQKTYSTWHDDFSGVKEVSLTELDKIADGGTVTFQPGVKLITNQNTAKVYAVGNNGELSYIPSEATASELFGKDWAKQVVDIDPGIFASTYKNKGQEISDKKLPDGTLVEDGQSGNFYLIDNQKKRKVDVSAYGRNGLEKKLVVQMPKLPTIYQSGDDLEIEERHISQFSTGDSGSKVKVCHKDDGGEARHTIEISSKALDAHLAHGDSQGVCSVRTPIGPMPPIKIGCDNSTEVTRGPFHTTYWTDIGLDTLKHSDIQKYQIQWFAGHWSPWFTPGVDDLDWNNFNRRVWALFDDHTHRILTCDKNNVGPAKADFTITNIYILPPQTVKLGDTIMIVATVKNLGAVTKESPIVKESGISINEFSWLSDFVPDRVVSSERPLYQNESLTLRAKGKFNLNGGMKTLRLSVDPGNLIDELNENNNQESIDILVLGPVAHNIDISAISLGVLPSEPIVGIDGGVKFEGKNNGDTPLTDGLGLTNFFRFFGDFIQTSMVVPNFSTSTPLLPKQSFFIYFIGHWGTAGEKSLSFKIDNANELVESNEENNWVYKTIIVTATSTSTSTPSTY